VVRRIVRPVGVNTSGTLAALSRAAQQAFDGLVAVLFGGANIATLGVAGAVRQANRQLEASLAAQAATRRPGIFIQLPRRFQQGEIPRTPLFAAEERFRAEESVGTVPEPPAQPQQGAIDSGGVTSVADGTITFPDGEGRYVTLDIGEMDVGGALREWAAGRLEPIGVFATEDEAHDAALGPRESRIDTSRPMLENQDGSFSTEETITIEVDGRYYVIPTIVQGRRVDEDTAIGLWRAGGNPEVAQAGSQEEADAIARNRSARIGRQRQPEREPIAARP
jgi:hypothetical protein